MLEFFEIRESNPSTARWFLSVLNYGNKLEKSINIFMLKYIRYVIMVTVVGLVGYFGVLLIADRIGPEQAFSQINMLAKTVTSKIPAITGEPTKESSKSGPQSTKIEIPGIIKLELNDSNWDMIYKLSILIILVVVVNKLAQNWISNKKEDTKTSK
jgi:hypothetical protein